MLKIRMEEAGESNRVLSLFPAKVSAKRGLCALSQPAALTSSQQLAARTVGGYTKGG